MKGKLIKMVEGYTLSLTGNIDDLYAISNKELAEDHQLYNLSMKNCQAIENGYDLDELGLDYYKLVFGNTKSYKDGFQKCLELLGDKKFSENDIRKAIEFDKYHYEFGNIIAGKRDDEKEEFIQSLKVSEWDVEIEMKFNHIPKNNGIHNTHTIESTPKLDSNGCLILKRI